MQRHILLLDLKDDPELIAAYETHHAPGGVWDEVLDSIRSSGIRSMEIFRTGTRLVMLIEADDSFDFRRKADADAANPRVREWEALMDRFQQRLPGTDPGTKWQVASRIFTLPH